MPDLSGMPAVDVALGLAFLFFLLSLVCSSINEAISSFFKLRARNLERGIRSMLDEDHGHTEAFYNDKRVVALIEPTAAPPRQLTRFIEARVSRRPAIRQLQLVTRELARLIRLVYRPSVRLWRWIRSARKPSYIPSRVFTLAVLDTFVPEEGDEGTADLEQHV